MGLRSLFKVRRPGNGKSFEGRVKSAESASKAEKFPSKSVPENSRVDSKKVKVG